MPRSIPAVIAAAALALGAAAPASAQTTAPALGGTTFADTTPSGSYSCNDWGASSGQYSVDGTSTTGAYPGTWTETGSFTASAPSPTTGRSTVTGWTAQFEIDSPAGRVTGTKTFDAASVGRTSSCGWSGDAPWFTGGAEGVRVDATIALPDGRTCTATGRTTMTLGVNTPTIAQQYLGSFVNDLAAPSATCDEVTPPPPSGPQSKDDCKDGGPKRYGFRNQGECIAAVLHPETAATRARAALPGERRGPRRLGSSAA